MAIIVDYGTLKTAVADYLARSDLTSFIPNFIQTAENRLYRDLRVRQMLNGHTYTTVVGETTLTLHSRFIDIDSMSVQGGSGTQAVVERASNGSMITRFPPDGASGRPKLFRTAAVNLVVAPTPDAVYTLHAIEYQREDPMSASSDAPWPVTTVPEMLLYAALVEAAPFVLNDARTQMWEQKYQTIKADLIAQDTRQKGSGGKLRSAVRD